MRAARGLSSGTGGLLSQRRLALVCRQLDLRVGHETAFLNVHACKTRRGTAPFQHSPCNSSTGSTHQGLGALRKNV